MRAIFQTLLFIVVAFAYVAGPNAAVAIEHSHELGHHHGHHHDDHHHSHHHPHDHAPLSSSEAPDEGDSDADPHSHTHLVSLGADTPFIPVAHHAFIPHPATARHPAAFAEIVPDGPSFSLIKPPQLG